MSLLRAALVPKASFTDLANPSHFLFNGGFGRKTIAGENVSPATALTLSTWFACVRAIAEDVGKLPFVMYKRQTKGGKKHALDHPVYSILQTTPNPDVTAMTFRETMTGWALSWGNAYAEIERDGTGAPIALWPIHPARVRVRRVDGGIVYDVWSPEWEAGDVVRLPAANMLHIRGFGDDPICGLSVARLAAESIGLSLAQQTFGSAFFGNGATLGTVLEHPGVLSEPAQTRLRVSWGKIHGGADNAHKLAILEEGMKANKISVPPDEAQFIESRTFQNHEIARFFRMPVHKIQQMDRATFSNIEQQSIEYVVDCLQPWLTRWEQECQRKLLDPREVGQYVIEHTVVVLMRGDSAARSNYYRTMISTGVMTPNEAREMESMNPVPGEVGDQLYMQGAMSTLDRIVAGPPPGAPGGPPDPNADPNADPTKEKDGPPAKDKGGDAAAQSAALRPVFDDAEARCRRKEEMAFVNARRKYPTQAAFATWADTFYSEHLSYLVDAFSPCIVALSNAILAHCPEYDSAQAQGAAAKCLGNYCANALKHAVLTGTRLTPDQPLAEQVLTVLSLEVSHA